MNLWRRDLITRLCRDSGCLLIRRDMDRALVRVPPEGRDTCYITAKSNDGFILLAAAFPLRFSLERTPSSLFARVLLRGYSLNFSAWQMDLGESCEATLLLMSQMPTAGMTPKLFGRICREITDEVLGFHQELRDKFRYDLGGVVPGPVASSNIGTFGQVGPDVRFLGPVEVNTVLASRPRHLPGQGG